MPHLQSKKPFATVGSLIEQSPTASPVGEYRQLKGYFKRFRSVDSSIVQYGISHFEKDDPERYGKPEETYG